MQMRYSILLAVAPWLQCAAAQSMAAPNSNPAVDRLLDHIVARERALIQTLRKAAPIVETYIQETPNGASLDGPPVRDHYFLGRFSLPGTVVYQPLVERTSAPLSKPSHHLAPRSARSSEAARPPTVFLPRGFAQMTVPDLTGFDRENYSFEYIRREFLGEVRCLVFDVAPRPRNQPGRFVGRIWVEDRDDSIVRFNGTYVPTPTAKGALPEYYFHFDSWRLNATAGAWIPAQIYVEEEGAPGACRVSKHRLGSGMWRRLPAANWMNSPRCSLRGTASTMAKLVPRMYLPWRASVPGSARPRRTCLRVWSREGSWHRRGRSTRS